MLAAILGLVAVARSLHVDPNALTIISGALVPFLTALITNDRANAAIKLVLTSLLVSVAGAVSLVVTNGGNLVPSQFVVSIGLAWFAAIGSHYSLGITGLDDILAHATGNIGIGPKIVTPSAQHPSMQNFVGEAISAAGSLDPALYNEIHNHLHDLEDNLVGYVDAMANGIKAQIASSTIVPVPASTITSLTHDQTVPLAAPEAGIFDPAAVPANTAATSGFVSVSPSSPAPESTSPVDAAVAPATLAADPAVPATA